MPREIEFEPLEAEGTRTPTGRGTVYIVQVADDALHRFHKAKRFGELVPLMQRDAFPDNADEQVRYMRNLMKTALAFFNPARDYVLLAGDPIAIAMCILTLSCVTLTIPCLKWDRDEQDYYNVIISV